MAFDEFLSNAFDAALFVVKVHRAAPTRKNPFVLETMPLNVFNGGVAVISVAINKYGPCTRVALQIE